MNGYIASVLLVVALAVGTEAASVAKPTCGGSTSSKEINLINPLNPPRSCEYHINAYSKNVCQLRIDFGMTLAQPTVHTSPVTGVKTAECVEDYFEVNSMRFCGVETWQHIYVPFNASAGDSRVDLQIVLAHRAGGIYLPTPEWNMVVTQLVCPAGAAMRAVSHFEQEPELYANKIDDGFYLAPPGCLQYFPHAKGVVKSVNFNDGNGLFTSFLNYAMCFRRTTDTTALTLRLYSLNIGDSLPRTLLTDNSCLSGNSDSVQNADFLMVPQAQIVETQQSATYFCGEISKDVVITSNNPGPLMVLFKSGEIYDAKQSGFAFTYTVK